MKARFSKRAAVAVACLAGSFAFSGLRPEDQVAVWHMEEGEGTSVSDASGHGHHGIINGAAGEWSWGAALAGTGLRFNGSEHSPYVLIPNHEDFRFGTGSFTLEAWVKSDGIRNNGYGEVVLGTNWASSCGISLALIRDPATGNPLPVFTVATGSPNSVQSGWTIPTDAWIHLVGVRDAGADRIRLFVNGELAGTMEDASGSLTSDQWAISGQYTWAGTVHGCFHGTIDEVTVTNRPLSALEIRSRYEAHAAVLEVSFDYLHMATLQEYPMARLYDSEWRQVSSYGPFMSQPARFPNLGQGDYYLWTGMFVDASRCGSTEFYPFNDPYVSAYHNGSPDQAGATKIHVASPGTTRLGPVRINAAYFIGVTTSPEAFTFSADHPSCVFTAPQHFAWKAGETHSLAADDTVTWPDGGIWLFDHWSQGGPRIQNYTVPAGTKKDTLIARYVFHLAVDIVSEYGVPEGEGWHPAWQPVTIRVDSGVVETIHGPGGGEPSDSVRHVFNHWTGTGLGAYSGTDNPATFSLNQNVVETAHWKTQFPLIVTVNDTTFGRVEADPAGVWQDRDSTVYLRAVPSEGCVFASWGGACSGTADTASVRMDTSKAVIAVFIQGNRRPVLALRDTSFAEDETLLLSRALLESCASDPDDAVSSLIFSVDHSSSGMHGSPCTCGIRIWAEPDWNGNGWIVLRAADPSGSSGTDTLFCSVVPVNDPPGPFRLIRPEDGHQFSGETGYLDGFVWTTSANRDGRNGDAVSYEISLRNETEEWPWSDQTSDTVYQLPALYIPPTDGIYRWSVKAVDSQGLETACDTSFRFTLQMHSGARSGQAVPKAFGLSQNRPNPFNHRTVIEYEIPKRGKVILEVWDLSGRRIAVLLDRIHEPGVFEAVWDGTDGSGRPAGSGIYVCRMRAGGFVKSVKMGLLK
jgi:hypothetical protein